MASTPKSMTSPQDSILSCPVCMDIYKTPRMLPCQHTLCESCLHSYIVNKSRERVLVSDFPCPVCRTSTPAPRAFTRIDTWAHLFPLNHLLVSLLDSSFQDMLDRSEHQDVGEKCPEHVGKLVEFFCTEHGVPLCSKCFKNSHRQCDIIDIEDHIEFTSRFNTVKSDVDNVQRYLNEVITHLRSNIDQLLSQKSSIITEVKDFRAKVETLLNSFETDIKDQVNVQHDGEVVVLKAQCDKYDRIKSDVDAAEVTLSELPSASGGITQSIEAISAIENDLKSHAAFIKGCHSNIKVIRLEFAIENQLLQFLNSFSQIGNVFVSHFDVNLKKPPELLSKGSTHNESFVPSQREAADDTQSPANVRHLSPRSIITSRPPTANGGQMLTTTPPVNKKQPKRPLTVPIESNIPTPVVRPRAERPDVQTIPNFLPRSFSSPVNETIAGDATNGQRDIEQELTDPALTQNVHKSKANNGVARLEVKHVPSTLVAGNTQASIIDSPDQDLPDEQVSNGPERRVWQYVNIRSDITDTNNCSEGTLSPDIATKSFRQPLRTRSASASDIPSDKATTNTSTANRIVRHFHEQPKLKGNNPSSFPLYENTLTVAATSSQCAVLTTQQKADEQLEPNAAGAVAKQCVKVKDACVRIQCDSFECTITGSIELVDKRLILVDCNNSRVKLLNKDFVYQSHIDMTKEPWNVTAMPSNDIAVTVPLEKSIHIIRVGDKNMETVRCIGTRRECWGICYIDGRFAVSTKDDGNIVVFLDQSGREIQVVNFASRENPNILRPVSVSSSPGDNVLYVACEGQSGTRGSVVRMTPRGDVLYVFTNKELDRPYSIAVGDDSNVYVTAIRSANVVLLSEGGVKVTALLSRLLNGLCRPQHIQTLSQEGHPKFLLSERRVDTLALYEIRPKS